jgi:photosystem II stability/assembly factor-like uncharacterized protein
MRNIILTINIFISFFFLCFTQIYPQEWRFLGLENESITAIAIDWSNPDIIYAGSGDFGGIFKSTNGGTSWDTLARRISWDTVTYIVSVRDLDIHPMNPQVIYVTLSSGIIKSIDGGINWTMIKHGHYGSIPSTLEIDPRHPDMLYTGTGGLYGGYPFKSTNGGESWFRIDPDSNWFCAPGGGGIICIDPLESGVTAIAVDPANTNTVYFGTGWDGYVLKTTDGGVQWEYAGLQAGITCAIEVSDKTSNIYFGTSSTSQYPICFFMSTDKGTTWSNDIIDFTDSLYVDKIQICNDSNGESIFLAGYFKDKDGSWKKGILKYDGNWKFIWENSRISAITVSGKKLYAGAAGVFVTDIATSVQEDKMQKPGNFYLYENYPNPFNPTTVIRYQVPEDGLVSLRIYDVLGREIKELVNEFKAAGRYEVTFDASGLASGMYLYRLTADKYTSVKKMVLLR